MEPNYSGIRKENPVYSIVNFRKIIEMLIKHDLEFNLLSETSAMFNINSETFYIDNTNSVQLLVDDEIIESEERITLSKLLKNYNVKVVNKDKNFLKHSSYIFTFGKYKGEIAFNVLKKDKQYILWLFKNSTADYMTEKYKVLLEFELS